MYLLKEAIVRELPNSSHAWSTNIVWLLEKFLPQGLHWTMYYLKWEGTIEVYVNRYIYTYIYYILHYRYTYIGIHIYNIIGIIGICKQGLGKSVWTDFKL